MPLFLLDVEDCVADRLLGVLVVGRLHMADNALDHDGLAPEVLLLEEVEEVFRTEAVQQFLVEFGEALLFFFGEAVERTAEEDTGADATFGILAVPLAFEEGIGTVGILPRVGTAVEPTVLNGEVTREGEFGADIRAGRALNVRVRQFGFLSPGLVENPMNGISHISEVLRLNYG